MEIEPLENIPLLSSLPEPVRQEVIRRGQKRSYGPGQIISLEGEPPEAVYFVLRGRVKIYKLSPEGRAQVLTQLKSGDIFNLVPALDEGPNPATAEALDQVTLYLFPRQSFIQMVKKHPDLAWVILENLAQRLRHLTALVEDLSFRTVRGRLAKLLLEQASKGQVEKGGWLTQEEMAARLGTVREVVSRSLRSLEEEGLIRIARHRIIILEREALEEQAV